MYKKIGIGLLGLLLFGILLCCSNKINGREPMPMKTDPGEIKALWAEVDKALEQGLPQSAEKILNRIYDLAKNRKDWGEALHALSKRISCQGTVAGNQPADRIKILRDELEKAPAEMKPMMKLMLTQWYWHYFNRNRWRFHNRSTTAGLEESDFTTWDLAKLFSEISGLFQNVLAEPNYLRSLPLQEYQAVLEMGNMPPELRSTLYDFAAWTALEFYSSAHQAGAQPENAFEIDAASPALGPWEAFIRWRPETNDTESAQYRAAIIYQELLRFHQEKGNRNALADTDLHRLQYIRNIAFGESAAERYQKRLREWTKELGNSDLAAQACHLAAREKMNQDDAPAAMKLCEQGLAMGSSGRGKTNCAALKSQILQKEFEIQTEAVQLPGRPIRLTVRHRNMGRLHLRIVAEKMSHILEGKNSYDEHSHPQQKTFDFMIHGKAEAEWSVPLETRDDFRARTQVLSGPSLPQGIYRILVSPDAGFRTTENKMAMTLFQVSRLALIHRAHSASRNLTEGFVCDGENGLPLEGVTLTDYRYDHNSRRYTVVQQAQSDQQGLFSLSAGGGHYYGRLLLAESPRLGKVFQIWNHPGHRNETVPTPRTVFFTDRSIYRPGQDIHFKGILLKPTADGASHEPVAGQTVRVTLLDTSNQEAARLELRSNDFGSITGTFSAPSDRLSGRMSLRCSWSNDRSWFNVEEYKRPKFEVNLALLPQEFRLGDRVSVNGEALSYTGAAVDGAVVRYRVTRQVQFPRWWSWFFPDSGQTREIAHGRVKSDAQGRFSIEFKALPDLKVKRDSQPIFSYRVSAEVTDSSGETRSDETLLRLGYTALAAELDVPQWAESGQPQLLTVRLSTHDGQPLTGKGIIEIHTLKGPERPVADREQIHLRRTDSGPDWQRWPLGELKAREHFTVDETNSTGQVRFQLPAGTYRARLITKDRFGAEVEAFAYLLVHDPGAERFPVATPLHVMARKTSVEAGERFEALLGTGYARGSLLVETFCAGRLLERYWTSPEKTQHRLVVPVTEAMRGGFTVMVTLLQEQMIHQKQLRIEVPWSNRHLSLQWRSFRSKLLPGQKELWTLLIKGPNAEKRAAELAATLYDQSLDQFLPHRFPDLHAFFRQEQWVPQFQFSNHTLSLISVLYAGFNRSVPFFTELYPVFPDFIREDFMGYAMDYAVRSMRMKAEAPSSAALGDRVAEAEAPPPSPQVEGDVLGSAQGGQDTPQPQEKPKIDLGQIQARSRLNETAFFFPQLRSGADGVVRLEFTMPEALTRWRFLGLAHTRSLEYGFLEDQVITQKDLMVQPNPPRFLREGDELEFTVKVSNQSEKEANGSVRLDFFDPLNEKDLDLELGNRTTETSFSIPARQSRSFGWKIRMPDGIRLLGYRAVAAAGNHSDGEENQFPVLSRFVAVQEALPLWISQAGEKEFTFQKLKESGRSDSLRHLGLTLQMASNPAWYAVQALPYLMEYPYECSEQNFSRLYANTLARHIAGSDVRIRRVFDAWKGTEALKSNLEKNQELKSALLEESPWVLEADDESQAKRRVGLLFDENHMNQEIARTTGKLKAMQYDDGAWPWFPGGPRSDFITLYIMNGFGRLRHLGVSDLDLSPAIKACGYLDRWIVDIHRRIIRDKRSEQNNLSPIIALYLYARSFLQKDRPLTGNPAQAVDYFMNQAKEHWLKLNNRMSQAQLALGLNRLGDPETAQKIMRSMKERSQFSEEMGRFWSELEFSWWWYRAPIETQALMIEAFAEVMNDTDAVEECKIWLLKQKQTRDWKTTKATADAVYGLLLRGEKLLASDKLVEVRLGGLPVKPEEVELGTGFYEKRFSPGEIRPEMGEIRVKKNDPGIAWGGVHWHYLEDIAKITPHDGTPLSLKKRLFVRRETARGRVIEPVSGPLEVGDLLAVRIELRSDRDMEYLHLKDHRGSGLEPLNVLSRYQFQDGLAYYESTKDTASHFFIDYLPKGTYVFEYELRVVHRGRYQTGMAAISCMYAPEFNSHSESIPLEVQ